jgi:hypothetical protein
MKLTEDLSEWSEDRLRRRLEDLKKSSAIAHNDERWAEIQRDIKHVTFELKCRQSGNP